MSQEVNAVLAGRLLRELSEGQPAERLAELFSPDVRFEVPGDSAAFPWIGQKIGRHAATVFFAGAERRFDRLRFEVEGILADDTRAVVLGQLASRVRETGKLIESAFAMVLTIDGGEIVRFQFLEDSFAVSRAAMQN